MPLEEPSVVGSPEWQRQWGDRIIGDPTLNNPMTAEAFHDLVEELPLADKPVGVMLDAQTLGRLFADHTSPFVFQQFLLEQFKQAGCDAVSGVIKFKLHRGKIFKLKAAPGEFFFRYLWLAPILCAALGVQGDDKRSMAEA
jgi:hypothetical protein